MLEIDDIIINVLYALSEEGYTDSMMKAFEYAFRGIERYFLTQGRKTYDPGIGQEYIAAKHLDFKNGDISGCSFSRIRRSVHFIESYHVSGEIILGKIQIYNKRNLIPAFSTVIEAYAIAKRQLMQARTIRNYCSRLYRFFLYAEDHGHKSLEMISPAFMSQYISSLSDHSPEDIRNGIIVFRSFWKFANEHYSLKYNCLPALQITTAKRRHLIPYYTLEEIDRIINAVDRNSPPGKRDYAILLLAKSTGLRSIDIIRLRFENINWAQSSIQFIQSKTGRVIELPLEALVGNAIIEYIQQERPASTSTQVFLRAQVPHTGFGSSAALGRILKKHVILANISSTPAEKKGFHCFRRSLGTYMLRGGVPLTTISQVLGHSHPDTAKSYLSTNGQRLKECALDFEGIELHMEALR